jgi:hypothetical protein
MRLSAMPPGLAASQPTATTFAPSQQAPAYFGAGAGDQFAPSSSSKPASAAPAPKFGMDPISCCCLLPLLGCLLPIGALVAGVGGLIHSLGKEDSQPQQPQAPANRAS